MRTSTLGSSQEKPKTETKQANPSGPSRFKELCAKPFIYVIHRLAHVCSWMVPNPRVFETAPAPINDWHMISALWQCIWSIKFNMGPWLYFMYIIKRWCHVLWATCFLNYNNDILFCYFKILPVDGGRQKWKWHIIVIDYVLAFAPCIALRQRNYTEHTVRLSSASTHSTHPAP